MTFRELNKYPRSLGWDVKGFYAKGGKDFYRCFCMQCGSPITKFAPDPLDDAPDRVLCSKGHVVREEDIVIVKEGI